ncbi:hypothetical protein [Streptomyces manipurensis]|uniref:hypothetical protein n=1 Tax=Streptomyces manipurensis TaxID=1077945 RepID=UPI003C6ED2EF
MSAVLRVRAAEGVLRAAMEQGIRTPEDLAQALEDCRLLQSPETAAARAALRPVTVPVHTIDPDVAEDSPAADLALRLRTSQPDVLATDVRSATHLQITVRPQSPDCMRWWLGRFETDPATGIREGAAYTVRGHLSSVDVELVITGDAVTAWAGAVPHAS